jgi:hypothetical protein
LQSGREHGECTVIFPLLKRLLSLRFSMISQRWGGAIEQRSRHLGAGERRITKSIFMEAADSIFLAS